MMSGTASERNAELILRGSTSSLKISKFVFGDTGAAEGGQADEDEEEDDVNKVDGSDAEEDTEDEHDRVDAVECDDKSCSRAETCRIFADGILIEDAPSAKYKIKVLG